MFWTCKTILNLCQALNFVINAQYSKKNYDNPNYYASLVIFQTYKNTILRSAHSLGWLFWLWFYPNLCLCVCAREYVCDDLRLRGLKLSNGEKGLESKTYNYKWW